MKASAKGGKDCQSNSSGDDLGRNLDKYTVLGLLLCRIDDAFGRFGRFRIFRGRGRELSRIGVGVRSLLCDLLVELQRQCDELTTKGSQNGSCLVAFLVQSLWKETLTSQLMGNAVDRSCGL